MTHREGLELLWLLHSHWPTFDPGDGDQLHVRVATWAAMLDGYTLDQARAAIAQLAREGREFPPTPGQVTHLLDQASGSLAPDVDAAFGEVHTWVRRVGHLGAPAFSHPAIDATVRALGGWPEVCASQNPEALRAHFRQFYATAAARADREATMPPVLAELTVGLAEVLTDQARAMPAPAAPPALAAPAPPKVAADGVAAARSALRRRTQSVADLHSGQEAVP